MPELHLHILFNLDSQKEDLPALSLLTSLNFSPSLTIDSSSLYLRKQGLVLKSQTFLQIILSKEAPNIYGTIFLRHLSKSMLRLAKDQHYPPFYPLFTFLHSYISQKSDSKILTFQSPSFHLLTIDFSLFRISLFPSPIHTYSVATIFFPNFQIVLVSSSNILKLKYFTLTDLTVLSILLLLIFLLQGVLYFVLKICGDIWVSYSTGNYPFINTSTIMPTKRHRQPNA